MENLLTNVGRFADIDTRLKLGVPPGKLGPLNFVPRPIPPVTWRFWPAEERAVYICFSRTEFEYDVWEGIYTEDGVSFKFREDSRHSHVWQKGKHYHVVQETPSWEWNFQFAQIPQTIVNAAAS